MTEGFRRITQHELAQGTSLNLQSYKDSFSPYSFMHSVRPSESDAQAEWVDTHYGLIYSDWINQGGSAYGVTDLMPTRDLDELAELGFLRVPFARFPRLIIRTRDEFGAILKRVQTTLPPEGRLLLRGQTREYSLGRSEHWRSVLYGDTHSIEPSLSTSASRAGINIDQVMPQWCGLIQLILDLRSHARGAERPLHEWFTNYNFSRFCLAIAQHYGLPSSGLDVTSEADVALFFALKQFSIVSRSDNLATYEPKLDWSEPSVIYGFIVPTRGHAIAFEHTHPPGLMANRPERQNAFFLHRGWGLAHNDCARWLAFAIYIDESFEPGDLPSATALFPPKSGDPFAAALAEFRGALTAFDELGSFLSHLYWIQA